MSPGRLCTVGARRSAAIISAALLVVLGACSSIPAPPRDVETEAPGTTGSRPAGPRTTTGPTHAPARADAPAPGTSQGDRSKLAAEAFVESVGSWEEPRPGSGTERVVAAGYPAELVAVAPQLVELRARRARTSVVFAQQAGLTSTAASVVVLARQIWGDPGRDRSRELTLDIRLNLVAGRWEVTTDVVPPRPRLAAAEPGGPTTLGRTVLDDPRLALPEPVRRDITERRLDDPALMILIRLANRATITVQVAATGHPGTVFPTNRLSNHAVGRAVDITLLDGVPVEDLVGDPRLRDVMVLAGDAGATEVGGPIPISGTGYFTDAVHRDHIHGGITPTKPPARAAPR